MRYLILSDIHANLPALEAVLADATRADWQKALVLGDLVGYGASPADVIDAVDALDPLAMIRGNHDKVCAGLDTAAHFNPSARQSIEWTRRTLSPAALTRLAALPRGPMVAAGAIELCHGAPFDEDYYVIDAQDAARALRATTQPLCCCGHTHVPCVFSTEDLKMDRVDARGESIVAVVRLPPAGRVLVNVGSVGQPRDGDSRAAYGIVDLVAQTVELRRVEYDISAAQRAIIDAGLPRTLATRLEHGI